MLSDSECGYQRIYTGKNVQNCFLHLTAVSAVLTIVVDHFIEVGIYIAVITLHVRLKSSLTSWMIRSVMNVRDFTVVDAMPHTSVVTYTVSATTVSIAGRRSTLPQALKTIVASSKKTETVHVLSISFPHSPE